MKKNYSTKLYSDDNKTNNKYLKQFFNNHFPKLNEQDKALCDKPITPSECGNALLSLKNGKSPGSDGFPSWVSFKKMAKY